MALWGVASDVWDEGGNPNLPSEDDEDVQRLSSAMLVFFVVTIVLLVLYAVCSVLLIWGSAKGRRWLLLPWIVVTFAFALVYLVGMCLTLWLVGVKVVSVLMFFVALVEVAVALYLWVCVVSLHQLLGSEQWRRENNMEMKPKFTSKYNTVPTN